MNPILFWLFAAIAVVSSLFVVTKRSPMANALALALVMTALAGLFAGLSAPFLFIIQILVYTGAVVVLIIFVIMLLNLRPEELKLQALQKGKFFASAVVALALTGLVLRLVSAEGSTPPAAVPASFGTVEAIADELFTTYLLPFEVVSFILLVGIIGAVVVAKRGE
ncbi:MAG: NADH-quinone oxidoreductase subunit J [Candidatus Eisenbacteria bacterium]|nr:NADH-quinone oxidoreductase subunit J [Candidatus Eisenbacteria bacterium]MCC7140711.1 NADH-quinone oxidoreductase subunit J [Candidatus Eisenbacteria bacterium]